MSIPTVIRTELDGLELRARGKVRDIYDLGDRLLIVATDRVSAFDWVLPDPIPMKGIVLTQISKHWFQILADLVPHHVITDDVDQMPESVQRHAEILRGRTLLCRKAKPFGAECVARAYLCGSGWKDYQKTGRVCGLELPPGLKKNARLERPIFTPSTKAEVGVHDENIDAAEFARIVGAKWAKKLEDLTLEAFRVVAAHAAKVGITLCDTKLEWGTVDDTLILIDEAFTPDSSRFWQTSDIDATPPGGDPPSYDKQVIRNWLETSGWDKASPPPHLPPDIIEVASRRYLDIHERLVGRPLI